MDVFTLSMETALACGMATGALWLVQRAHRDRPGLPSVTAHLALTSLALVLIALRGRAPAWLTLTLPQLGLTTGYLLLLDGCLRFAGRARPPRWFVIGAVTGSVVAFGYFGLVNPDFRIRAVWQGLLILSVYAQVALVFWRLPGPRWGAASWLGGMVGLHASFHCYLAMTVWLGDGGTLQAWLASGAAVSTQLETQVVVLAFALLLPQRLAYEYQVELKRQARRDPLTGLLNRRGFAEAAERILERSRRAGQPVALAMGDLDHFKTINDRFGHPVGDDVLVEVARRLELTVRPGDLVARYGGEEFVVLLLGVEPGAALALAERLRIALAAEPMAVLEHEPLRSSWGVAFAHAPQGLDDLVAEADRRLYMAKRGGRDRVMTGELPKLSLKRGGC